MKVAIAYELRGKFEVLLYVKVQHKERREIFSLSEFLGSHRMECV